MLNFFRKYHKWIGLFFSFFIIMFSISGILLNHRKALSTTNVSRSLLPKSYHYENWNNGAVKGAFYLSPDSVLFYGGSGIWLADSSMSRFADFNAGLKKGTDNRITSKIIKTKSGKVFAATTFDLYQLGDDDRWINRTGALETEERLTDLAVKGDSLVVLSRSEVFISLPPYDQFRQLELKPPVGYTPKVSLFRTMWLLHGGELFGLPGRLFVDILGIVMIVLCVTGIIYMFLPRITKKRKEKKLPVWNAKRVFTLSLKWHNKLGVTLLLFLLLLSITRMFLRPPLLIAIIRSNVKPIPGSVLDSENPWNDKLRCLVYDERECDWLLYTSSGFYAMNRIDGTPVELKKVPPVSVMGVSTLEREGEEWVVGSFSGLYRWNRSTGKVTDAYTGKEVIPKPTKGRPVFNHTVSGYVRNNSSGQSFVFEYDKGAIPLDGGKQLAPMPENIRKVPMSLWHACLEIHVGRVYHPFLGPVSELFVFLAGFLLTFILLSGYVVYRKLYKLKPKSTRHRKRRRL